MLIFTEGKIRIFIYFIHHRRSHFYFLSWLLCCISSSSLSLSTLCRQQANTQWVNSRVWHAERRRRSSHICYTQVHWYSREKYDTECVAYIFLLMRLATCLVPSKIHFERLRTQKEFLSFHPENLHISPVFMTFSVYHSMWSILLFSFWVWRSKDGETTLLGSFAFFFVLRTFMYISCILQHFIGRGKILIEITFWSF